MKSFTFASIAGIFGLALAQEETKEPVETKEAEPLKIFSTVTDFGDPTYFQSVKDDEIGSTGEIGEVLITNTLENGEKL